MLREPQGHTGKMAISGIREASRLIFVDELTGLYNRRFMRQYLRERLDQLARDHTPLAVIMLDLDGFKQINDTYGHLDGDLVLKRLGELIRAGLPANAYAIRFAGDEFFAFLEGVSASEGVRVAEGIRERVNAEPFVTEKAPNGITVRISLGVAAYPEDAPTPSELIEAADQALYRSKRSGKNCVSRAGGWALPAEMEVLKRFPCPRLVGRDDALAELERPLSANAQGKNRFLLIEAQRGLGKSRLLLELMRRASARGFTCLFGRCLDAERAIPYSSLTSILSDYLGRDSQLRDAVRARLPRAAVKELGTLIAPLATAGEAPEPLAPEDHRSLLFHAMEDLLSLLSDKAPLLFLDDLQFVDEASLEVLYRLLDRDEGKLVVYATAQSEALAQKEGSLLPLVRLFTLLQKSPNFVRLTLGSLSLEWVSQMVTEILERHTPSPGFFQRLYEASEGIPLFVEETLKGLITKGALKASDGVWNLDAVEPGAVPASLEAAVLGGLEALDREIHTMISKAAVMGPHVDVTLLAGVLGKNPGETLELVDRGKKQRVFEEPGPLADEDEVRFLSQCFQQIVYSHLDRDDRRQTHRVVAEVTERLAGPQVEQVLGPLAYHFERSDDAAKGEFYRRRVQEVSSQLFSAAEIARELSLKVGAEAIRPLDERTWPFADRFLRTLTVAVKNMRVYPDGSQVVVQGVAAVKQRLFELLECVEAVTFAEESQVLQINGEPVASIGLLPVAQDLLRIYADHGVRRCTFERGMTAADMMGLLKILSGPPHGIQSDVAYWDNRLKSEGIGHVRVFPVIFLATGEGRQVWRQEQKEARLEDATLALVRDVLRALATVVDNIRLYPPESQLITQSLDQLERHAQSLFTRVPTLTVALTEGTIVVNATRPNPRLFGITIEILERLMEDCGLTSLTIRRGATREHLRVFLTHLAQPPEQALRAPAFWRDLLEGGGISTIEVGTRLYAAAARLEEAELAQPDAPVPDVPPAPSAAKVSEAELTFQRVAQWLKEPLATFLEREIQEQIPTVLSSLRQLGREDLARQLVERTATALAEPDGRIRRKAAQGLTLSLRGVDDETRDWLLGHVVKPLSEALKKEADPMAYQGEAEVAGDLLRRVLHAGDLSRGIPLAEALGASPPGRPNPEKFTETVRGLVEALSAGRAFEPVFRALKDADPTRQQQGQALLAGLGAGAVPFLVKLILEGGDEAIARAAATLLRAQGDAGTRLLTRELDRKASVEEVRRIVAVLDLIAPVLGNEFLFLLGHPEVEVRADMARTLTRVPREHAARFLGQALRQSKFEVVLGALECVCGLRMVELLDSVVRLLDKPPNDHVLRVACLCLGRLKDPRAVPPLLQILQRRPRFFGLRKGLPEAIRATAARSLGELQLPEAKLALEAALKDPGKTVRSAARLALLRVQQQLEPKP